MQRPALIFEYSPLFLIICILLGLGYAIVLYKKQGPWGANWNKVLFGTRWLAVTVISMLLVSPILKQVQNEIEKSTFVIAIDNSRSVTSNVDSASWKQVAGEIEARADELEALDFEVEFRSISQKRLADLSEIEFQEPSTNLYDLLKDVNADFEGRNLGGILLFSDGIHNQGLLPTYANYGHKIYSLAVGDTVPKSDIVLSSLLYNKISYQGNKFPLVAQLTQRGFTGETVTVTVSKGNNVLASRQARLSEERSLTEIRFEIDAKVSGYQSYTVSVERKDREFNGQNNQMKAYVEVIEGQEKIALVAAAPHPDIKSIRAAIESNENYSFHQFILSLPQDVRALRDSKDKFDLVIYHQLPGRRGVSLPFIQRFKQQETSTLWIYGGLTDLNRLNSVNDLAFIKAVAGEYDEILAVYNPAFGNFSLSSELQRSFNNFPPLTVPFGRFELKENAGVMLQQRVGSLNTNKPLVVVKGSEPRSGLILGSGLWRWKLTAYAQENDNELFNELISKLVQFLSSKEDKRKFKLYPLKNEFTTNEPVIFESEAYNDLYERIYGNKIDLQLQDEDGNASNYTYIPSEGNTRYAINGLKEGVYQYTASTILDGETLAVAGEFLVKEIQLEELNLTADYDLLRKLARKSGGNFFTIDEMDELKTTLTNEKSQGTIHSDTKYLPFINLRWIFFLILLLISGEWFIRKYNGSY